MLLQRHGRLLTWCGCGGEEAAVVAPDDQAAMPLQLSWAQVEAMTGGFTSAVVGEGGFSTVYLARLIRTGHLVAVKKVHHHHHRSAFRQELDALLRVRRHPHIVRLLGFCCASDDEDAYASSGGVLVLELAPNGNLHDRLHHQNKDKDNLLLPWRRRVSVAAQVARALAYLHECCEVVHGDVKASNVLLDASMAARLCDFGSARRSGFVSSSSKSQMSRHRVLHGSPGYVDPHYLRSGVLTTKSDVYSFGVLLLELVTGVQPSNANGGETSALLTKITTASCSRVDDVVVAKLVDRRLGCRYDSDEAAAMLALAAACVADGPSLRPSMPDVVRTLDSSIIGTTRSNSGRKNLRHP